MRVHVVYAHPVETSYGAALFAQTVESLKTAGHEVDACDLYQEGFNPIMSRDDRLNYHTVPDNIDLLDVRGYVERLRAAEALVLVSPVWNMGLPAMLKGYFDRVWLPGVSFDMSSGAPTPMLKNIRKLTAVFTYGGTQFKTFLAGNPPRKYVMRTLRVSVKPLAPVKLLAHYDMNHCTAETRASFLGEVKQHMESF